MPPTLPVVVVCLAGAVLAARAEAQETPAVPAAAAVRVSTAPVIDGRLDDRAWQTAAAVEQFRQKDPAEGEPASEQTRVRIVYDGEALYLGVELTDREPSQIRATELRRDNPLDADDTFSVLIDSFHDHRNAFVFRVNPRGTRYDAVVRNESRVLNADWDEQWTAAAQITERGWTAEIAIPFKVLRFTRDARQVWGLNFERVIKRRNELAYWAAWDRDFAFHHVSQAGHLSGLEGIRQAERIRLRPYVLAGGEFLDAVPRPEGARLLREVGIDDLKVSLTSSLTADLALNPDFAQTEVDAQRVNLTRFSLFFPEKRQFFIEGAESLKMGVGLLHFGPPPLELFYSRNIGLSQAGTPIPVIAGGKMTGKVHGFDVGLLNVQTDAALAQDGENFAAARVRKEVFGRSYVGAIATNREGHVRNRLGALDGRFVIGKYLNVSGLLARADDARVGEGQWARQMGAEWRDDRLEAGVNYIDIDPEFNPGLGYVRRRDRMLGALARYKPRPGGPVIRQLELNPSVVYYHAPGGVLLTRQARMGAAAIFHSGDRIDASYENDYDRLPSAFRIGPAVVLPPGEYEWNVATLGARTFNGRRLGAAAYIGRGGFYNGDSTWLDMSSELRWSKNVSLTASYNVNDVSLAQGAFVTHLLGVRANVSLSTSLLTSAYVQYNNTGQLAATQVRVNYIFRTIDNVYLVLNESRFTAGPFAGRSNRSLVMKVTYSLHR